MKVDIIFHEELNVDSIVEEMLNGLDYDDALEAYASGCEYWIYYGIPNHIPTEQLDELKQKVLGLYDIRSKRNA